MVSAAIAEVLHVPEVPGQSLTDSLHAFLRPRRMLLLLDNFEHILEAGPWLVEMLQAAPRLALSGYQPERSASLRRARIPGAAARCQIRKRHARRWRITVVRWRSSWPAAAPSTAALLLTNDNAREIAVICQMLDGLPLAIELAAARSELLVCTGGLAGPAGKPARLPRRPNRQHDRHQTLRAALDWSYQLLAPAEQQLVQNCSLARAFTLEQADAVCTVADVIGRR